MKVRKGGIKFLNIKICCIFIVSLSLSACSQKSARHSQVYSKDIVILGEFHGTQEIGDVLVEVVSEQVKISQVAIGLEAPYCALTKIFPQEKLLNIPGDEGKTCDIAALEMGRISEELFMSVSKLIEENDVKVFGLEDHKGRTHRISKGSWDANEWEGHVVERILYTHRKGYKITVIIGNLHARKTNYQFSGPSVKPVGARLSDKALIVELSSQKGGHAYACQTNDKCGVMEIPERESETPIGLSCTLDRPEYDCIYTMQKYSAAKPLEDYQH